MKRVSYILIGILVTLCLTPTSWGRKNRYGPVYVSKPVVPVLTPAARDVPDYRTPRLPYKIEAAPRETYGFTGKDIQQPPHTNALAELQRNAPQAPINSILAFGTPLMNFPGQTSPSSPPDTTGDVGKVYFLQGINGSGGSAVGIYDKATGNLVKSFLLDSLATSGNCTNGYCDPVIIYDEIADRWLISEFASTGSWFCVYISQTNDPTGQWYFYEFDAGYTSVPDYPKYGVWPQDTDNDGVYDEGSYLIGVNAGSTGNRDVFALDREKMLLGQPATLQKFSAPALSGWGFQLFLPAGHEGADPPPNGAPALFLRPVDTEIHSGYSCTEPCDIIEMWGLTVDWNTPSNSSFTRLNDIIIGDYDQTLCGTSTWACMPQQGTTQKLDPIREPMHFQIQYYNHGTYETIVGCFPEDVDGTDRAAVHWFELRGSGTNWSLQQEGVVENNDSFHRSVCSAAMDSSGNIAVGYTRTSSTTYPSIYYSGRRSSDPAGTMPLFDNVIIDATTAWTANERWGDYSGIGLDPTDHCTFWYTTEYGGNGETRIAAFKFTECGCTVPSTPTSLVASPNGDNSIALSWSHTPNPGDTYNVYRAVGTCPQSSYTLIASGLTTTSYVDNSVSGGITYAYVVTAVDQTGNCETVYSNCAETSTTGACLEAPQFNGLATVTNPGNSTCTLDLAWDPATPYCGTSVVYSVYRSTTSGFTPDATNRIASCLTGTTYSDTKNLVNGTTYYYIVRAEDPAASGSGPCGGAEDANTVEKSGTPTGASGTLLSEAFSTGIPGTWTIINGGTCADTWTDTNPGNRNPGAPFDANFAIADSDNAGSTCGVMDEQLITPSFNASAYTTLTLEFSNHFRWYSGGGNEIADVDVTNDGGTTWINVLRIQNGDDGYPTPNTKTIDISAQAAGQTSVQIRFRYYNADWDWYWAIDNVTVTGDAQCTTLAGIVKPVPDNHWIKGNPMMVSKVSGTGQLNISWDTTLCPADNYNLLYGFGSGLSTYTLSGSTCDLGTTGTYTWTPPALPQGETLTWWLLVGTDTLGTESSWGKDSSGTERSTTASGMCTNNSIDTTQTCP